MPDPVVVVTAGIPTSGSGTITTLGQTLLDGANVTQGATTDAAVAAGAAGTISAKLRAISRDIAALSVGGAGSNPYAHIATLTTTTVKSGSGTLVGIVVNQVGTDDSIATMYDNTSGSGTVIGVLNTSKTASYAYNLAFSTGLTIVTAGTTAPDLTVVYR